MCNLFTYGNVLGIVAVPVLSAPVYFTTVWAVYDVSWPNIFSETVPAVLIFLIIPPVHLNFISILITPFAYIYRIFILTLEFTPTATNAINSRSCVIKTAYKKNLYTNLVLLLCGFPSRRCPILLLQPLPQLRHLTGQVKYWSGNRVLEMFSVSLDNWSFRLLSVLYTRCGFLAERTVMLFNSLSIADRNCS